MEQKKLDENEKEVQTKKINKKITTKKENKKIIKKVIKRRTKKTNKRKVRRRVSARALRKKTYRPKRTKRRRAKRTQPKKVVKKEKIKQHKNIRKPKQTKGKNMEQSTPEIKVASDKYKDENGLIDPEKIPIKVVNTLNVGQYVRKQTQLKVSPSFVYEEVSRLKDRIDEDVMEAEKIAKGEGMKTLMDRHLIHVYNFKTSEESTIISCGSCAKSFAVHNSHNGKDSIMCCPFCGQKRYLEM